MNERLKLKLDTLPHKPGSYQYKDKSGQIIYVGKAKDLSNRVHSYFVGSHDAKTTSLVSQIDDMEYIITSNENEAFILEINLIKKYRPKYNIMLMDDKQYPYITITNEKSPRVLYTRDIKKSKGKVYGPYPNAKAAQDVVEMLNRMYPFRKCKNIPKKECLYYHINQCLAPCINDIDSKIYDDLKQKANSILKGNVKDEIKILNVLMETESNNLNFEKAIEYRNLRDSLLAISERQKMEGYSDDIDAIAYYVNDEWMSIQVFHLRNSKMLERNGYLFAKPENCIEKLQEFVYNFYLVENNPIPKQIFINDGDVIELSDFLHTHVNIPKKGKNKELIDLVIDNAKNKIDTLIRKKDLEYKMTKGAMEELSILLGFDVHTIEAFDNSNIQGASAVSAMVSYLDGIPNKKMYRKYKIKTVVGANDYLTMQEVVTRRYKDLENNPDLIVMDGGEIQVNACKIALSTLERDIPVLGLVKNDNHKTRCLYYEGKEINIEKNGYLFRLLENIQEEVHRYAITFFRSTHNKDIFSSKLDDIKGIGKVKKTQILKLLYSDDFLKNIDTLKLNQEQKDEVIKVFNDMNHL